MRSVVSCVEVEPVDDVEVDVDAPAVVRVDVEEWLLVGGGGRIDDDPNPAPVPAVVPDDDEGPSIDVENSELVVAVCDMRCEFGSMF